VYPLYKEEPKTEATSQYSCPLFEEVVMSQFGNNTTQVLPTSPTTLTTPHTTTQDNTTKHIGFIIVFVFHKPASKGTPLPGIHDPPAKNSPTVNFTASALEITRKPPHFTLPPVPAPAPVFACSP